MKNWMVLGALIGLSGCASPSCEYGALHAAPGDNCRAGQLLYQNDMLQAKLLISQADRENYELAEAMLRRAALTDASGEAEFYQAVLLIRQQAEPDAIIERLQTAADHRHPLAIALLSQQLTGRDDKQAAHWRAEYAELDVAKSGYPSFEQALMVIDSLVTPAPEMTAAH
ncbi:hypothetical protein [Pseudomonas ovata]|uniref:hypothetical protein n=1 Tax=Pseudomonas ovata TaxID=1839709 RepID=UPI000D69DEAC|nr:hypothetical protein [Pseudomonas ovata]